MGTFRNITVALVVASLLCLVDSRNLHQKPAPKVAKAERVREVPEPELAHADATRNAKLNFSFVCLPCCLQMVKCCHMDQQGEKVSYNMMMVSESGWQVRSHQISTPKQQLAVETPSVCHFVHNDLIE